MITMRTPPTTRTVSWNADSDDPRSPAVAPRPANTVVKPAMNNSVAGTARGIVRVTHLTDDDPEVRRHERHDARREERRDAGTEQRDHLGHDVAHPVAVIRT